MRKTLLPVAIFSIYPIFIFFLIFWHDVKISQAPLPVLASLYFSLTLYFVLVRVFKSRQQASFVTVISLVLFFSLGYVRLLVQWFDFNLITQGAGDIYLSLIWLVLLGGAVAYAVKRPSKLRAINQYFVVLSAILLLLIPLNLRWLLIRVNDNVPKAWSRSVVELQRPEVERDIYFIVLDGYAGESERLEGLGFDNSEFVDSLWARGFYVAEESRSSYFKTMFSLASTLNMQYLDVVQGAPAFHRATPYDMVENNQVASALQAIGYTYVHLNSGSALTDDSEMADVVLDDLSIDVGNLLIEPERYGVEDVHFALAEMTALGPLMSLAGIESRRIRTERNFAALRDIPAIAEPTFTFAHFIAPHHPFVFERDDAPAAPDGIPVDGKIVDQEKYEEHKDYVEQLVYVNRQVSALVNDLMAASDVEPIIIIQSDHGFRYVDGQRNWDADYYARYILPVFNAMYLPDGGADNLFQDIALVNTFPLIFNEYFGADIELLEQRHFYPEAYGSKPYEFIEMSEGFIETPPQLAAP